jgi:60 kDa SS-A/Ro ribonucleoprotein
MLRNYAQIARSGAAGKAINLSSSAHRQMINRWFNTRRSETLFNDSVGTSPSLVGVLRQAHVKPETKEKEALLKYLFNNEFKWNHIQAIREGGTLGSTTEDLPSLVKHYEAFKRDKNGDIGVPAVDFRYLDSLGLSTEHWVEVFRNAPWHFTRMNLNTAVRHGVLNSPEMVEVIADRLRDVDAIHRSRVFPYQLFTAFLATRNSVPHAIGEALQDAVEISLDNVPSLGNLVIAVDVSGSMGNAVTGDRGVGATSVIRNIDVAALIASALIRKNRSARVIPFANGVKPVTLNSRDSIMTNAAVLTKLLGGGTNCSAPLALLNLEGYKADTVLFLSDNESWVDSSNYYNRGNGTRMHEEWLRYKKHNPAARLISVDISPNTTAQVKERPDILTVAGFSDNVFDVMAAFARGGNASDFWLNEIDKVEI